MKKQTLIGLTREELESFAQELGEPAFRGRQLYTWLYQKRAADFDEMSDLPAAWRLKLAEVSEIGTLSLTGRLVMTVRCRGFVTPICCLGTIRLRQWCGIR